METEKKEHDIGCHWEVSEEGSFSPPKCSPFRASGHNQNVVVDERSRIC